MIENIAFSQNNSNNINVNKLIDLRQRMLNFINEKPNNSNWYNLPDLMTKGWKQICKYIGITEWYMLKEISTTWADYGICIDLNNINLNLTNEQKQQLAAANIDVNSGRIEINYIEPDHQKP